ncbi:MAG: hypothetical protein QM662_19230 [Gordonia sp. (in: high G+C Gram-positive bacteria)]
MSDSVTATTCIGLVNAGTYFQVAPTTDIDFCLFGEDRPGVSIDIPIDLGCAGQLVQIDIPLDRLRDVVCQLVRAVEGRDA